MAKAKECHIEAFITFPYMFTGSSVYPTQVYAPNDFDLCISCNKGFQEKAKEDILRYARKSGEKVSIVDRYFLPFGWGGETLLRMNVGKYDVFLVTPQTFKIIKTVTKQMINQPDDVLLWMQKSKNFRTNLFQLFAQQCRGS